MDAATPRPGRIGPYEILETLSPGPRSRTYKGVDPLSQRSVALKAIPKHLLDGERIAKLKQEVSAAARLEHQGIVKVFEYGEDHEWAYVAREFVEGWPIKERRRIPVGDGVAVMAQLLESLDYAHARGVVHGDLRPSNLLLTSKGLKVAGFGTASLDQRMPDYSSPEQFRDFPAEPRTDIFAAGIIFYELMTGFGPFAGAPESLAERVCNQKERSVSEVNPNVPRVFDAVCAKALSKSAHDRYLSARAFCDAIREAFQGAHGSQPNQVVSHETVIMATTLGDPEDELKRSGFHSAASASWDEATLHKVEKQLATFIGPLAKILVRKAAKKTTDLHRLYSILANNLQEQRERQAFLALKTEVLGSAPNVLPPLRQSVAEPKPVSSKPSAGPAAKPEPKIEKPLELKPPAKYEPKPADVRMPSGPMPAAKAEAKLEVKSEPKAPDVRLPSGSVPAAKSAGAHAAPERAGEAKPEVNAAPKGPSGSVPAATPPKAPPTPAFPFEELLGKQPENLAGYLKDEPAPHEDVIQAFVSTVDAVAQLHAAKSRVEPLTPQSICFDPMGKVTIVKSPSTTGATTSVVVGNPRYAVPEIFAEKSSGGESNIAAAHIYALGFMFYEILLGRKLFEKTFTQQRSELDWLRWHADLESKAPAVKTLLPGCPDALSEQLASMMEKRTEKRAADLQAITATLRNIARRANKTVVISRKTAAAPTTKLTIQREPAASPKKKSSKTLFVLVFLMIALAAGAFVAWQYPDLYREMLSQVNRLYHRVRTN